ncbi:MAG: DUF2203 family protein [Planctomycetota bacterium]|jgi:hypothetical protein|nr:DUF2203 family protein [Planctomycetota bacterium]
MHNSAPKIHESDITRYFTAADANAMIPLVKLILADVVSLANELVERQNRLDSIGYGSFQRSELYGDELEQIEKTLDRDKYRLQELLEELYDLGVHPCEPIKGIVAFPTRINDEVAFFTWKIGDSEVALWEDLEKDITHGQSFESSWQQSDN